MAILSEDGRKQVHIALGANYAALRYAYDNLNRETVNTVAEMVEITSRPYRADNVNIHGDTLDRHSYSCLGNLQEVITLMTLIKHEAATPENVRILRSIEDQVTTKADIAAGSITYQVKTATFGTGGQLFVAEQELEGTADYMSYVDTRDGSIYQFTRGDFRRKMKDEMDIGGPYDRWWGKAGWFVSPYDVSFISVLDIPPGVTGVYQSPYYNDDNYYLITRT